MKKNHNTAYILVLPLVFLQQILNFVGVNHVKKEVRMYKYKLIKKGNPNDKKAAKKWFATSMGEKAVSNKTMTRNATQNTTTAPAELDAALDLVANYACEQLLQGHIARIGTLGTLRVIFSSEGVENILDFKPTMIKNARLLFTPSKEFRESVINNLQFQNGGVLDDGINYGSLADYKRAKGLVDTNNGTGGSGGSGNTGGSGGTGGDGEDGDNPIG